MLFKIERALPNSCLLKSIACTMNFLQRIVEILYNKEICHLQLKKRKFICLSSKFYYRSGQ